jgi:Winged helix-turn helix
MAQSGCQILVRKVCPNSVLTARGTEGSNLPPSSGESGANLICGDEPHRGPGSFRGWSVGDLDQRRLTTESAALLPGLERRQVFRLLKAYRSEGATGLISNRRGCPSNRRKPEELRDKALAIIREQYWDFGPTLAAEKLREGHGIALGRETLRLWMIAAGIWADRKQRRKHVHQPRHRRECVGELVLACPRARAREGCRNCQDRGRSCQ